MSEGVEAGRPQCDRKKLSNDELRDAFDELASLLAKAAMVGEPGFFHDEKNPTEDIGQRWCESCFCGFKSKEARDQHVKKRHIHCRRCKDLAPYPTHQALYKMHRCLLQCRYCSEETTFRFPWDRDQHIKDTHFPCMVCREIYNDGTYVTFRSAKALLWHKKQHHGELFCDLCDKSFTSTAERQRHDSDNHVLCPHCPHHLYRDKEELETKHRQRYCHFCRQRIDPHLKRKHMEQYHPSDCEDCAYNQDKDVRFCAVHEPKKPEEEPRPWGKFWSDWYHHQQQHAEEANGSNSKRNRDDKKSHWPEEMPEGTLDLYAILNVDPQSHLDEIKKAAKEMRIATHPDRLVHKAGISFLEVEMINETAKMVGFAADILTKAESRRGYDEEVKRAASKSWLWAFWA